MKKITHIISFKIFILILLWMLSFSLYAQIQYSNLPSVYINTENSQTVSSKTNWLKAEIMVVSTDTLDLLQATTQIRGRGNSTWSMAKKPYRIKLDKKERFLGMYANAKNWVFLANYADKTLMRNALAFHIGRFVGLEFTPSTRFVDLVLNNSFLGNYMVTDQVEVHKHRVAIDEQDSSVVELPDLSGGYLLEIDGFASSEPVWFTSSKGLKITIKSPDDDDINEFQKDYIVDYINNFESRLFSSNFTDPEQGYRPLVDSISLVNWYIASELTGNSDAFWSTYIYKKRQDDKLYFGPLWDYDIAFNNDDRLGDATEKRMSQYAHNPRTWIQQFLRDEWFQTLLWRRWSEMMADNITGNFISYINETAELLEESQQLNFQRWNNLANKVYRETFLFDTYGKGVNYLKTYMSDRIQFLNQSFVYTEPEKPTPAFVPGQYFYMIMNKRSNNVIQTRAHSVENGALLEMWEPVENEAAQLWEFRNISSNIFYIINKNSGLAMTGKGYGNNLAQQPFDMHNTAQQWRIEPIGTQGLYGLVNVNTGYSVNNSGGSYASGTNAIEWSQNIAGSENQQFYLQKMQSIISGLQFADLQKVEIYPNPARSFASVRWVAPMADNVQLTVHDLSGKVLTNKTYEAQAGVNVITLSLEHFTGGVYFVRLRNSSGATHSMKLMVNK